MLAPGDSCNHISKSEKIHTVLVMCSLGVCARVRQFSAFPSEFMRTFKYYGIFFVVVFISYSCCVSLVFGVREKMSLLSPVKTTQFIWNYVEGSSLRKRKIQSIVVVAFRCLRNSFGILHVWWAMDNCYCRSTQNETKQKGWTYLNPLFFFASPETSLFKFFIQKNMKPKKRRKDDRLLQVVRPNEGEKER